MWNRRTFLKNGCRVAGGMAAVPYLSSATGCPSTSSMGQVFSSEEVLLGLYSSSDFESPKDALRLALDEIDFTWLSPGDSVLIKVASNSGRVHPATTSPDAIRGLCETLFDHGAGRVLVADQAGVEQVRLVEGDIRFRATVDMFRSNGLLDATEQSGAEAYFFDDHGFQEGYFEATLPAGHNWRKPAMIPTIIREVDHIIYAPRISSHALSGYTHGHKIAIGWLRDDSRNHLHHDAATFYEKFTEINYAAEILDKFRFVVTFATSVLLENGPDFGTIAPVDPWIVLASPHLAHHDAVSVALLNYHTQNTPSDPNGGAKEGAWADLLNFLFLTYLVPEATGIDWGPDGAVGYTHYLAHAWPSGINWDRCLGRAYSILGEIPEAIDVVLDGKDPEDALRKQLESHSGGILNLRST